MKSEGELARCLKKVPQKHTVRIVNWQNKEGKTLLHVAVLENSFAMLNELIRFFESNFIAL